MARTEGAVAVTTEQIVEILDRLPDGLTLKQSVKKSKLAYFNIVRRINADPDLKYLHAQAREEYARTRAQDIHDIAENTKLDPATRRMMIDAIKWEVARVLPKEFGDRVQQEVIITNNTTLSQRMSAARKRAQEQAIVSQFPPSAE